MELGTVLFYANYDDFIGILKHMKVDAEALSLEMKSFNKNMGMTVNPCSMFSINQMICGASCVKR